MNAHRSIPQQQQGAALVVVLIILVIVTLLGLASLRGTLLQERMSGNQFDRSLSFQAAENALETGERAVVATPCDASTCPVKEGAWLQSATWTSDSDSTAVTALGANAPAARYMRERMGTKVENGVSKPVYRITARAHANGRAEVILQSLVQAP